MGVYLKLLHEVFYNRHCLWSTLKKGFEEKVEGKVEWGICIKN